MWEDLVSRLPQTRPTTDQPNRWEIRKIDEYLRRTWPRLQRGSSGTPSDAVISTQGPSPPPTLLSRSTKEPLKGWLMRAAARPQPPGMTNDPGRDPRSILIHTVPPAHRRRSNILRTVRADRRPKSTWPTSWSRATNRPYTPLPLSTPANRPPPPPHTHTYTHGRVSAPRRALGSRHLLLLPLPPSSSSSSSSSCGGFFNFV